jgi:N-acetylneuraminic acid mutarotase
LKKYFLFITIFFILTVACKQTIAQGVWTQKATLPTGPRYDAKAFSIGNKGYLGAGAQPGVGRLNDFWEYDPASNAWTQKVNLGGTARDGGVGFSIGTKGYIGTGGDVAANLLKDFWEYDPSLNTWTQKANFAGGARVYDVGFSIGNKGYVGTGHYLNNDYDDFWEYDPSLNSWTRKANFPGGVRHFAVGFSIGTKGYIGTGFVTDSIAPSTQYNDFWEYDPSSDTWTKKANFGGGGRMDMEQGFSIMNKGYCGTGQEQYVGYHSDFWEYNQVTDTWVQMADFGGGGTVGICAFSIGCKGYMGMGIQSNAGDLWEFYDSTNTSCTTGVKESSNKKSISIYPNPFSQQTTLQTSSLLNNATLTLDNCSGQIVKQIKNINGRTITLQRDNLSSGLYFIQLTQDNKTIAFDKLIIIDQ